MAFVYAMTPASPMRQSDKISVSDRESSMVTDVQNASDRLVRIRPEHGSLSNLGGGMGLDAWLE